MSCFIKRPVEVTAVQWTGDNRAEIEAFLGPNISDRDGYQFIHTSDWFLFYTKQRNEHVKLRDWVVKEGGEFKVVDEETFCTSYDSPDEFCGDNCCEDFIGEEA